MAKYVKSVVKINKMAIKALNKAAITALEQTGDALMGDVVDKQVIPFNVGTLQNESTHLDTDNSKNGVVRIISSTPYARRLYYHPEYNFQTINNPNAKGKWFEDWMPGGKYESYSPKAFAKLYKKLGGL